MVAKKSKAKVEKISPKALQEVVNKRFGEGTMIMGSDESLVIERISSGILSVDALLGGGFARGRSIEIYGNASVGKGYLAQKCVAAAQEEGGRAGWVDAERTFDPKFAKKCGVDNDNLALHRQKHGSTCVDFMETLLRSELYDVLVLDSIAALLPIQEYENDMEQGSYGMEQAKLMSKALRKLTAANKRTVLIFINQTREAVGGSVFGPKSTTSGGRAMAFYAGTRLEMVRVENLKKKGRVIDVKTAEIKDGADVVFGHRVLVKATKDKTGGIIRPQDESTFVFDYEKHQHDEVEDLIYLGRRYDFIEKSGDKWWVVDYEDEKQHGRPRFKKWLKKNAAVREELEEAIRGTIETEADLEDEEDS